MNIFRKNFKEVIKAVVPIVIMVLIAALFIVDTQAQMIRSFVLASLVLIGGLTLFLTGVSLGVERIAVHLGSMAEYITKATLTFLFGFLLGFVVTIAEPNLMVFSQNVESIVGFNAYLLLILISVGVGLMIGFGFIRILKGLSIKKILACVYLVMFIFFFTQNETMRNLSFDSSGASTGALTTPFFLSLAYGLSRLKGTDKGEKYSFGLVGMASTGPIAAVLLLGLILPVGQGSEAVTEALTGGGVFMAAFKEATLATLPITIIFLIFNAWKMKVNKNEFSRIMKGLLYAYIGLILFLTGVNMGFSDMAFFLGTALYVKSPALFIIFSLLTGLMIVLAEPAVQSLVGQIIDVTGGSVNGSYVLTALSVGVGSAVMLSAMRIHFGGFQLWMYLTPGFLIAIMLFRKVDDLFVGISFDAGGVASGPMTTAFALSMMQGAATVAPNADPLVDGFGVIASVAMAPVVSLMLLGLIYAKKR